MTQDDINDIAKYKRKIAQLSSDIALIAAHNEMTVDIEIQSVSSRKIGASFDTTVIEGVTVTLESIKTI